MTLSRRSTNNKALSTALHLVMHQLIVRLKIETAVGEIGCLDGGDEPKSLNLIHVGTVEALGDAFVLMD